MAFHERVGYAFGVEHFSAETYSAHTQNFGIVQDKRGMIYVANLAGVLEFDSVSWRTIKTANSEGALSLAVSDSGTVFVGAKSDIGYLEPDSIGRMQFVSLLDRVPADARDFAHVWSTHATSHGIYFHSNARILRWDGARFESWPSSVRLHTAFSVYDRFFVRAESIGLMEITGDTMRPIQGGSFFADKRVVAMAPAGAGSILIAAQVGIEAPLELYLMVEGDLTPVKVDPHLEAGHIAFYHGTALPGGYMALSTLDSGVYIVRVEGTLVQILNEDYGVAADGNYIYTDANAGMWIAHNTNGITRIEAPVALTQFEATHGLKGVVHDMRRHDDWFYVAAAGGVYRLRKRDFTDDPSYRPPPFERIPGMPYMPWSLAEHRGDLLAGTEGGIMILRNNRFDLLSLGPEIKNVRRLLTSSHYPDRLYVGMDAGLGRLEKQGDRWRIERIAPEIEAPVLSLREAKDGTLWVVTYGKAGRALWKIVLEGPTDRTGRAVHIEPTALPWSGDVVLAVVDGEIRFIPKSGLYRHRTAADGTDRFVADTLLTDPLSPTDSLITMADMGNAVWLVYRDRLVQARKNGDGTYTRDALEQITIPNWETSATFYKDSNDILWIASGNLLYRYIEALDDGVDRSVYFQPIIRGVTVAATNQLLRGGGSGYAGRTPPALELDHTTNDLTFEYVLPDYAVADQVTYSVMLENTDMQWSPWSTVNRSTYRNLKPGHHKLYVRAQTRAGLLTEVATISFHINRSWFWNPWAWLVYSVILITPVVQFIRYRRAKVQLKDLEMERLVNARLNEANVQLRSANDTLKEANRMKDEFLASASHELRTPLTAILGFTSVLKEEIEGENLEFLELIDENGKRLLKTINSLLDLTKLRAGMLDVELERIDVCSKSEEIAEMMSQLARNKNIKMEVHRPDRPVFASLDVHCFERIMFNLLGNAIKFTDEGEIAVVIEQADRNVQIHVRDSGVGISESFLPQLFREFKQEPRDDGQPEGSGLGLAITAHLVQLMQGTIHVDSVKGAGSTFTVVLPLAEGGGSLSKEFVETSRERPSHPLSDAASSRLG